jgi:hypothetical protein
MPLYIYQNPKTQEVKEIVQSVHDKHEYSEGGVKWNRVFTVPQVGIDSKLDANSTEKDFVDTTGLTGIPLSYVQCVDGGMVRDIAVLQEMNTVTVKYMDTKDGVSNPTWSDLYSIDITTIVK